MKAKYLFVTQQWHCIMLDGQTSLMMNTRKRYWGFSNKNKLIMKADLVLIINSENPLMAQIGKILGKLCTMYDFTTIAKNEKSVTLRHDESGLVVAYTSEERLNVKH